MKNIVLLAGSPVRSIGLRLELPDFDVLPRAIQWNLRRDRRSRLQNTESGECLIAQAEHGSLSDFPRMLAEAHFELVGCIVRPRLSAPVEQDHVDGCAARFIFVKEGRIDRPPDANFCAKRESILEGLAVICRFGFWTINLYSHLDIRSPLETGELKLEINCTGHTPRVFSEENGWRPDHTLGLRATDADKLAVQFEPG